MDTPEKALLAADPNRSVIVGEGVEASALRAVLGHKLYLFNLSYRNNHLVVSYMIIK